MLPSAKHKWLTIPLFAKLYGPYLLLLYINQTIKINRIAIYTSMAVNTYDNYDSLVGFREDCMQRVEQEWVSAGLCKLWQPVHDHSQCRYVT